MSDEIKQFGLYKIISGIVIFGLGIIIMLVLLVVDANSDDSGNVGLIIGISMVAMFVFFYLSLVIINGRRSSKLKQLVREYKSNNEKMTPEDIAIDLKVSKEEIEQYY